MDLALFFVLPLVGGFAFVTESLFLSFATSREDGQRLYYRAALWAVLLTAAAAAAHELLQRWSGSYQAFVGWMTSAFFTPMLEKEHSASTTEVSARAQAMRFEVALVCVYAFILGAATPIWNRLVEGVYRVWQWLWNERALPLRFRINLRASNPLEELLIRSVMAGSLIQVTLSNAKVYVGTPLETPDPDSPAKYLKIQPWMSGYRGDDGRVDFNTFYDDVLEEFRRDPSKPEVIRSFQVVIPVDKVVTASGFDVEAYERFLLKAMPDDASG